MAISYSVTIDYHNTDFENNIENTINHTFRGLGHGTMGSETEVWCNSIQLLLLLILVACRTYVCSNSTMGGYTQQTATSHGSKTCTVYLIFVTCDFFAPNFEK